MALVDVMIFYTWISTASGVDKDPKETWASGGVSTQNTETMPQKLGHGSPKIRMAVLG